MSLSLPHGTGNGGRESHCGRRALIVKRPAVSSGAGDPRHHSRPTKHPRRVPPPPPPNDGPAILVPMPDEPSSPKRLIVVGDRVLIAPEEGEERTNVGLYLPPTAVEARQVQGGRVVATGPGTPMTEPASMDDEPWKIRGPEVKYLPMQARMGDYALFFR